MVGVKWRRSGGGVVIWGVLQEAKAAGRLDGLKALNAVIAGVGEEDGGRLGAVQVSDFLEEFIDGMADGSVVRRRAGNEVIVAKLKGEVGGEQVGVAGMKGLVFRRGGDWRVAGAIQKIGHFVNIEGGEVEDENQGIVVGGREGVEAFDQRVECLGGGTNGDNVQGAWGEGALVIVFHYGPLRFIHLLGMDDWAKNSSKGGDPKYHRDALGGVNSVVFGRSLIDR